MIAKSNFEEELYNLLIEKKYEIILEFLRNTENEQFIKSNVWNLVNKVCVTLKTNSILKHESDLVLCKKILLQIVDHGSPKEVVVALMEEADCFKEHAFFCLLLDPLKETLKKVPNKRGKSLEWVLNTLNAHIESLPPPKNCDLEGEETLLLDATTEVMDVNYILTNYFSFLDFFVNEASQKLKDRTTTDEQISYHQEILQKYILKLFHHPFLFHDLHVIDEKKPKSTTRVLCEKYMKSLSKICNNVFTLFQYDRSDAEKKKRESSDEESVSVESFSCLSYLIFVEELSITFQPFVYNHRFIFMSTLRYILLLLSNTHNFVYLKGLLLAEVLLGRLEDSEISYNCVEIDSYTEFSKLLLNISIYSQVQQYRQLAVKNFMTYLNKCDSKARYHLIMQVVCTINHSGCKGLAISLYRNYLHDSLVKNDLSSYFMGKNLISFMKKILIMPEDAATDLLEHNDQIISTLNFLRYVLLRDKKEVNRTGIWNLEKDISETYLLPLRKAIDLSRAHYKETEKEAEMGRKIGKEKNIVTVNNTVVPRVAWKTVFEKALVDFDLLESILSRVCEIID